MGETFATKNFFCNASRTCGTIFLTAGPTTGIEDTIL
jgi:hypothetical protein